MEKNRDNEIKRKALARKIIQPIIEESKKKNFSEKLKGKGGTK